MRFADLHGATAALRDLVQSGLHPSNCRVLDPQEALLNRVVDDGTAVMLLGFESDGASRTPWMEEALRLCDRHGGRCPEGPLVREGAAERGSSAAESWRSAFFDGPYLLNGLVNLGVIADTFETACTWDRFDALYAGVVERMQEALARICGAGVVTCRITHAYPDGLAPYFTFVGPGRRGEELTQWAELKALASDALLEFGGTITHHHAVGRTHRRWYDKQRPELFARALVAAKTSLDPNWILNPGVLIDPPAAPARGPGKQG